VVDRPDVVVVEGINVLQPAFDLDDRDGGRSRRRFGWGRR